MLQVGLCQTVVLNSGSLLKMDVCHCRLLVPEDRPAPAQISILSTNPILEQEIATFEDAKRPGK
jgi:hypothetical protein